MYLESLASLNKDNTISTIGGGGGGLEKYMVLDSIAKVHKNIHDKQFLYASVNLFVFKEVIYYFSREVPVTSQFSDNVITFSFSACKPNAQVQ